MRLPTTKIGFLALLMLAAGLSSYAVAYDEVLIKNRKPYGKTIRTRMPPQILIEAVQNDLNNRSLDWSTFWQNFVIEDDPAKDEFLIIARSVEKPWAFGVLKHDCPKPENFDRLKASTETGGMPVRLDALIGVKKKRSWFRYVVTVYEPMYPFRDNPCYIWNLPPGKAADKFYKDNYTMEVYAKNLSKKIHDMAGRYAAWKPPKKVKRIPAMKGRHEELIGGDSDELTDEERKLPIKEQERILKERRKFDKK